MSGNTSYVATTANLSIEQEIERLREDSLLSWKKEARILKAAGLQDGMSILEAGSGPGFSTERLLKLFPNSRITCLDVAPAFLEHARKLLGKDADRVELVEGSVLELPFPESTFDFVLARYLMQHLSD